jgi:hypothetical protein
VDRKRVASPSRQTGRASKLSVLSNAQQEEKFSHYEMFSLSSYANPSRQIGRAKESWYWNAQRGEKKSHYENFGEKFSHFREEKVRKKLVRNFGEKKVRKFLIMRNFLTLFSQDG